MTSDPRSPLQKRLPVILIGLLVLLLGWALIRQLEWVEEEIDHGPTTDAKRNPFLASQRLLEQYDIPLHTEHGFSNLMDMQWQEKMIAPNSTLILINTYQNLHERQVEHLWRWVEDGGRLIVSVESPFIGSGEHLRDPLLTRMGMALYRDYGPPFDVDEIADQPIDKNQSSECSPPKKITETEPGLSAEPDEAVTEEDPAIAKNAELEWTSCSLLRSVPIQLAPLEPELVISISSDSYFRVNDDSTDVLAGNADAAFLVRQLHGRGEIYAITSATAWQNNYIGCDDNAYLFWRLTHNSPEVWYAINMQTPSFWRHLWQLSAAGCLALLLALVCWLWTQATRFGPIFRQTRNSGGRFIDHIRATAQFALRHQGNEALVDVLRNDITHRVQKRFPGFAELSRSDKISTLHTICGVPTGDIDIALFHPMPLSESQFLDVVKCLQYLRNRL